MNAAIAADFLARSQRGEVFGLEMRQAFSAALKSMTENEWIETCCAWYAHDPDSIEALIRLAPNQEGREAFHKLLIRDYAKRKNRP